MDWHELYKKTHKVCAPGEHSPIDPNKCTKCGIELCELCGSDEHFVGDGHNLNDPRYWGV